MRHALWSRTLVEGIVIGAWARLSGGKNKVSLAVFPGYVDAEEDTLRKQEVAEEFTPA